MTRPSTRAVRRSAVELSERMTPHLAGAKDTLDTVLPRAKDTLDTVRPRAKDTLDTVLPRAKDTLDTVLPKAKATGVGLAVRAGLVAPPKKRHRWRTAALVGAAAVGAYAAWNAWRLPHASDDWTHADVVSGTVATDDRTSAPIPGVAAGSTPTAF